MELVKRTLGNIIIDYINSDEEYSNPLLLSGARQVGKTTLIEYLLRDRKSIILNFFEMTTLPRLIDATETFEEFERLLLRELNFRPSEGTILVFDEAQETKQLGRWLGFFKKKWRHQKVIVSGSILSNLFEEGVAYPVGRVDEIVLRPFTFKEYLSAIDKTGLIEIIENTSFEKPFSKADRESFIKPYLSYLQIGGMPEIVIKVHRGLEDAHSSWDKLLRHYALDVERHMEDIYKSMFVSALDRIADITCHPIKNSQIISTGSPSYRKLPKLLEVMEKWHLACKVSAQTKHPESASGLASKRYLFDLGLVNFFVNSSSPVQWAKRSDIGNLVYPKLQESFVCNEIIASFPTPLTTLNYYRETRNSKEIDFIFPAGNATLPIEVKSQSSISKNSLIPMLNYLDQRQLTTGILVFNGDMKTMKFKNKTILAIPPFLISELQRLL